MPFVVAAVLAYALNPVVRGLERVGKPWIPSIIAVLLVEIGFLVMVVAVSADLNVGEEDFKDVSGSVFFFKKRINPQEVIARLELVGRDATTER